MSNSGYRGRSFGSRGARTNGPANGYSGPRFPHSNFSRPRPPPRLPGPDKWIERPNFAPWQQNNNFLPHPQYRGNLQFRPNGRGRAAGGRGIVRFSGPGRPPASQFCMGYKRNLIHRAPLPQEDLIEDKTALTPQTPLLGSEEERLQKISETADKLKQKLSSITEEELTNFWEDDLSILSNTGTEEDNIRKKGIPELRHEPPELDLTFTDFRDIGRVDCNSSKVDNVDSNTSEEIIVTFEQQPTDRDTSTNDEITIIDESKDECLITTLDLTHDKDDFDQSNILLEDDKCPEQTQQESSNLECNVENLEIQDDKATGGLLLSNSNDGKLSPINLNEHITDSVPIESVDKLTEEESLEVNDTEVLSVSISVANDQDTLEADLSQDQNNIQADVQDKTGDIVLHTSEDVSQDHHAESKNLECNQVSNDLQTNVPQETVYQNLANVSEPSHQNLANISEPPQNRQLNPPNPNDDIHSNITCHSTSTSCSTYNEVHKLNDDKKFNKPPMFQARGFNKPPRFAPRIGGPRGHWTGPQNGKNVFFRGPQRLPFHDNRMPPPKHVAPFPVGFDPRAPPPFISNDLPPAFDPSEPPPNIRPIVEPPNKQDNIQTISSLDPRSQVVNSSQSNINVVQPPPAFDPRGPPPRIPNTPLATNEKLPEFNPQQPPPKIHKREETLQPPPIFDPRLSSQERSSLIVPLDSSRSSMMPMNLIETPQITDYSIGPVAPNFSQLSPMNMPPHQPFISTVQMNFQPVLSQTNSGQTIMREFAIPPPPMNITEVPPLPPKEPLGEENSILNQSISMDDGLEDMQEAMEFAKQIMNMTEETKNENASSVSPKVPLTTSHIPVPIEDTPHSSVKKEENASTIKKRKKKESKIKKSPQNVVCGPELIVEPQAEIETVNVEQSIQNQNKNKEDAILSNDQIRPKVVFNLNSKTKKIQKVEEWQRTPISIPDNRESSHQSVSHVSSKEKIQSRKYSSASRRSTVSQNKSKQKEGTVKVNSTHSSLIMKASMQRKPENKSYRKDYIRNSEKSHSHSSNKVISNKTNAQRSSKPRKEKVSKKAEAPTLETSWKNRVISRFLKMSKNDICNMVNNSSLRKFDIAMKHLVKERKSSLSLEMRNTEDEKMKEYDREEFMNQLNAMLDPSAVVAITDLPNEFIHHLSEVLQLERMPFDAELPENSSADLDEVNVINRTETSRMYTTEYSNVENPETLSVYSEYSAPQKICGEPREIEEQFDYNREESIHFSLTSELNLNLSREDTNSSHRSLANKINPEPENTYKKQQQPLFNEADLDDILSEVTGKTKNLAIPIPSLEQEKSMDAQTSTSLTQAVITEAFEYNTFSQIPNETAADLDDIFSAGIARVKLLGKSKAGSNYSRGRKSSSEDRNNFRSEKYERWSRKEREAPDTFRNLTKEEWEAKYGATNVATAPINMRKSASNSAENLNRDTSSLHSQRYCSSDSPMRHLSLSPLTREASAHNPERYYSNEMEELRRAERSESSSGSTSSSSSDSDGETVAPNVTKLLKVIKEKEKIAKKKSLNETIRDEVAAEIEKKWKEKNKYKDRKSRKRERRKKDKREKRRKEKKKRKKRNSYSGSSKSGEYSEGFRLLTEDEIKKEIIVKEEPVSSFEENVPGNKVIDTQIQCQSSQADREQVPTITSGTPLLQSKDKVATTVMTVQPKTKAQLKQMPEPHNAEQEQGMKEQVAEIAKNNSVMNADNEGTTGLLEANKDNETAKSINEQIEAVSSTSISLHQTTVPLNTSEPSSSVPPPIDTTNNNTATHTTLPMCSIAMPFTKVNTNNQSADQKPSTSTSATEHKTGGYKKIDIKAYKERALQRRLKEQAMLKENLGNSTSVDQTSPRVPPNKASVESVSTVNELKKTEIDATKVQLKDPRLTRIRSTSTHSLDDSSQEIKDKLRDKPLEGECQPADAIQKDVESSASTPSGNSICEQNTTRLVEADLNTPKNPTKCMELKNHSQPSSQEILSTRNPEELRSKEKSRFGDVKKLKKPTEATELRKFKNIRSEGSKELKLKKEKARRAAEKSKKDSKPNETKSHKKVSEGNQESLIGMTNVSIQAETASTVDSKITREQVNTFPVVEQNNQECIIEDGKSRDTGKNAAQQVVERSVESENIVDQGIITHKDDQRSTNAEDKSGNVTQVEETVTTVRTESTSTKNSNKAKDVCKHITPMDPISFDYSESTSTDRCMDSPVPQAADYVSEETRSLSERTEVSIEKNVDSTNIESLKNVAECKNSALNTEKEPEDIWKSDNVSLEINDAEEQSGIKSTSQLHESIRNSSNDGKVLENEVRSPDSPSSPFKGFLTDSVGDDTYQVCKLYGLKTNSESDKENSKNNSKKWLDPCFAEKLNLELAKDNEDSDKRCSKERKEENETTTSVPNLMEKKKEVTEKFDTALEAGNRGVTDVDNQCSNTLPEQEKPSPAVHIDSHDIFDEDSEPFIVLDEYIDDADGKSMEKLSTLDLDLEECIARDADIFTNKSMQVEENVSGNMKSPNFNAMDFQEFSDVFDKSNINTEQNQSNRIHMNEKLKDVPSERRTAVRTELFASEERVMNATNVVSSTSESNIEPASILSEITKLTDSTVSEVPIESSQNVISTTSKDSSQRSVTPESSSTEARRTVEGNLHCTNISEYNMGPVAKSPNTSKAVVKFFESEISSKLPDPIKTVTETALIPAVNADRLELHGQTISERRNMQELNSSLSDQKISVFPQMRLYTEKDTSFDSIPDHEITKHSRKTVFNKSSQREKEDSLHKIKSRSKMKHKKEKRDNSEKILKEAIKSDTVKIKYPSTKEDIMARMIEIDVEIHKLMTEKMTLYQMLTNDALPADNNLQQNNLVPEEIGAENTIIRPRTPSALMSQLLQNIETSPTTNQCAKTTTENAPSKDNAIDLVQSNSTKALSKHDRHTKKKGSSSTYGSDNEEAAPHSEGDKSSKKRKKQKSEKVDKKSQNKLDINVPTKHMQNTVTEKKQTSEASKSTSKTINKKQATIEQKSSQVSITETQSQKAVSEKSTEEIPKGNASNNDQIEVPKCQEVESIVKPIESHTLTEEIIQANDTELGEESALSKNNEDIPETLNEKIPNTNSPTRPPESKTPERSSIYSDDSTWDSLVQTSSVDDQKKSNTGLALLEETYRKEMAKTRRVKAEARKKKKKKLDFLSQSVHTLTPEEEELPLSTLYIKKFYRKKKVSNSSDQQTKQQENNDPQLWKNLDDVINAVAEDRMGDLYVQPLEQESPSVTGGSVCDRPNVEENPESKENEEEQTISRSTLKNSEVCTEPSKDVQISCENKNATPDDHIKNSLHSTSSELQEFVSNEHFQQDITISATPETTKDIVVTSEGDTSTNIEKNLVEVSVQETAENDNVEINQQTSIEDPDSCVMVPSPNSTHDNQNVSNVLENPHEKSIEKEKTDMNDKVSNLEDTVSTIEDVPTKESTNSLSEVTSVTLQKNTDDSIKINSDEDTRTTSDINSKEDSRSEIQNVNEDKSKDTPTSSKKDNNVDKTIQELSYTSQDEHFISLKEHKEANNKKEIDRCSTASSEENNNQNSATVSFSTENSETLRNEEALGKKSSKRKRGSSRTPLRRSSRYTEEPAKRIKVEVDTSVQNSEQELQDKNLRIHLPSTSSTSSSPCEELENFCINPRKSRGSQRSANSRKRCTPMPPEIEIISRESSPDNEALRGIKRCKQYTMSEMVNCAVHLIDCRHTILNPNVSPDLLQNYGISRINTSTYSNLVQRDSLGSPVRLPSTKDLSNVCTKQTTPVTESSQIQTSKLIKIKSDQIYPTKVKKVLKSVRVDSPVNDNEECKDTDIEVMPVLTKEPVILDISQICEKPDIEIVEEKKIVTKNQPHSNSGLTLTVIDTKDDKELPRTQYTVHKGPILDIKVFENSFLAASEDGRIYRYNQSSNGILNIYKGHKAAVTCLYVCNVSSADISREWMFSGSLDGTLRCYNIMTGIQVRDTTDIGSPIQCMDEAWGIIFIGTKSGHVSRYHMKLGVIKGNSIQFSDKSVLALKATNEGPRRVLIVASRSQPITIRDAQNGLFLRTICGQKSHTVYSLMRDNNLIYCGTSSTSIPVFDFTNGEQTMQYDAGVGIVCMRLYKQLLFAGCYDGNIYVFDTKDHRLVCSIPGPGNMLLSMEVIDNKIIAGSKDRRLQSWQMPWQARSLL